MRIIKMINSEILIPIICFYIEEKNENDVAEAIKKLRKELKEYRKEILRSRYERFNA